MSLMMQRGIDAESALAEHIERKGIREEYSCNAESTSPHEFDAGRPGASDFEAGEFGGEVEPSPGSQGEEALAREPTPEDTGASRQLETPQPRREIPGVETPQKSGPLFGEQEAPAAVAPRGKVLKPIEGTGAEEGRP